MQLGDNKDTIDLDLYRGGSRAWQGGCTGVVGIWSRGLGRHSPPEARVISYDSGLKLLMWSGFMQKCLNHIYYFLSGLR